MAAASTAPSAAADKPTSSTSNPETKPVTAALEEDDEFEDFPVESAFSISYCFVVAWLLSDWLRVGRGVLGCCAGRGFYRGIVQTESAASVHSVVRQWLPDLGLHDMIWSRIFTGQHGRLLWCAC